MGIYCVSVCMCVSVYVIKRGIRSPGAGVTGHCEPPYGCWKLNSGPLQEQYKLLTSSHKMNFEILSVSVFHEVR